MSFIMHILNVASAVQWHHIRGMGTTLDTEDLRWESSMSLLMTGGLYNCMSLLAVYRLACTIRPVGGIIVAIVIISFITSAYYAHWNYKHFYARLDSVKILVSNPSRSNTIVAIVYLIFPILGIIALL